MAILAEEIKIKIGGKALDGYYFTNIQLVQELQKPNELRFHINRKKLAENEKEIRFSLSENLLGKEVDFSLTTLRNKEDRKTENDDLSFSGTIFHINILRNKLKANTVIEVSAYSRDYVLLDNPNCFSYEKTKLKDIVSETLKPYDISIQNNPRMEEEIPYTVQYNETSYDFLNRLARRYGEWVYYANDELVFGKIKKKDSLKLHFGADIVHYQYRLNMEHPNFTHAHHNYLEYGNTQKKGTEFSGDNMHNLTDIVYDTSKSFYSKETFQHLKGATPEDGFDEVETSAKVQGLGKKAQMMICQGKSNRADLQIGSVFKMKEGYDKEGGEIAWCYHDELLVYKLVHRVSDKDSYENDFLAVSANCEIPPYDYGEHFPKAGTQRAVVMENKDPEKLGRVRVQFLWQKEQDENLMTPWIRIAQPHGGNNKGFYFIPEVGEEVMLGFENGNAEKPYVIGTLYQGEQKPGENWYNEDNNIKAIRTRNGHTIEFQDVDEGGFIQIYDNEKKNYVITFSTDKKRIKLKSSGNIELYAEKDIILRAKNDIIMEAENDVAMKAANDVYREADNNFHDLAHNDILIQAENDIHTTADSNYVLEVNNEHHCTIKGDNLIAIKGNKEEDISQKYELSAMDIEADAKSSIKLSATQIEGAAKASMKVDGGGSTTVKGGMIQIG